MKIIDLLNKIAIGDTPKKIIFLGTTYIFEEYRGDWGYVDKSTHPYKWFYKEFNCDLEADLNSEVEIIEEEKEIEPLDKNRALIGGGTNETMLFLYCTDLETKLNEIIEAVNELRKEK